MYLYIYIKLYTISGMFSSPMPRTGLWRGKVQTHLNKKPVGSSSTEREREQQNDWTRQQTMSESRKFFYFIFGVWRSVIKKQTVKEKDKKKLCRLISTCFFFRFRQIKNPPNWHILRHNTWIGYMSLPGERRSCWLRISFEIPLVQYGNLNDTIYAS